ncbi:MAG: hypothetical protein QMD80_03960 [archaeon]|nr:hypothetical protein [archaeon]
MDTLCLWFVVRWNDYIEPVLKEEELVSSGPNFVLVTVVRKDTAQHITLCIAGLKQPYSAAALQKNVRKEVIRNFYYNREHEEIT